MSLVSFIWKFIRLQPYRFFFIFLLCLTWSIDMTFWPYLLRLIIDTMTAYEMDRGAVFGAMGGVFAAAVALWIAVEVGFRARDFLCAKAFPKLEADIRMAMFDHIQYHSPKYFNEHFAGSLANKVGDMTTQVTSILQNLMIFISAVGGSLLVLLFFYPVNPLFTLILGAWIVLHFSICFFFTTKCVHYSAQHGEVRSRLAGRIVDSFTNNFAVNLFARFGYEKERILAFQNQEKEKNTQAQMYVAYMLVGFSILFVIGIVSLTAFSVFYWSKAMMTTGEVVQVLNTTYNVGMVLWIAGNVMPQFFKSFGIAEQALTLMKDPMDINDIVGAKPLEVKKGEIAFERVHFQYGDKKLFEDKSLVIKGGEKVGLVGYSGAGKTSFVNLILRFFPVNQGRITIDGQDIAHVTFDSLRHQLALIPQDPLLFHRTLEENIRYGNLEASQEQVIWASKLAHCHEFIEKTPHGYKSLVGERGTKLSGGERQRIAIARAMLTDSRILILDEATSSLDSVTEKYIQEGLEHLMEGRTTIVIAHRLSTLAKMDRILVFDKGVVVEEGTHHTLLAKDGHYAHMWKMQAGGFMPQTPL